MTRPPPLRYVSRWSGIVVLIATAIFFAALLQAGVLQNLFKQELELRVILPESGVSGLAVGAEAQVLGTPAGRVEELVLDPEAGFHARVSIDQSMEPFVRRDSNVFIRKQFGIAGAAYLDITRGRGAELDWDYAVLNAQVEAAPAASVGELIEDLRERILPVIDDTHRAIRGTAQLVEGLNDPSSGLQATLDNLSTVSTRLAEGEGSVGRLLADDRLMTEVETIVARLKDTSAEITAMVRNSADASNTMPTLMAQTQQTLAELERLLVQLQSNWLVGGGNAPQKPATRVSPIEARE